MKVLVTGAAGFIGSHLCDRLIADGHMVMGVDSMYTGVKRNIAHLLNNRSFDFIKHDIVKPFNIGKVDRIYNLACPSASQQYLKDPLHTLDTNYLGTRNILDLAVKHKARILQASSGEVYGDPLEHPQSETYHGNADTFGARGCYYEGKRIAETLMLEYSRVNDAAIRVVRIFNTYGPRMDISGGCVVANFITHALTGDPLPMYGTGTQTRSFCYVDDIVEGMIRMMENPGFVGPVNLGNPVEYTMLKLAMKVKRVTKSRSVIECLPQQKDDPAKRRPDIALAKKRLGWEPKVKLDEGLRKTVDYFKTVIT